MASGTDGPHTAGTQLPSAEPERADIGQRAVADTERLGIDVAVEDRPAHAWEVGEDASWEPMVTDTWNPPGASRTAEQATARAGEAPETATVGPPSAGATLRPAEHPVPPADRAARSARQALEEAIRSSGSGNETSPSDMDPARMALGLASLAAERMRAGVPAGDGFVTGFGLARQTANGLIALGQRLLEPASRVASGAVQSAARLPVAGVPVRAALRSGQWLARSGAQVREKLHASIVDIHHAEAAVHEAESTVHGAEAVTHGAESAIRGAATSERSHSSPQRTNSGRGEGAAASGR